MSDVDRLEAIEERLDRVLELVTQPVPTQRWLTLEQAGTYAGVSEKSIRRLIDAGKLTPHRLVKGRVLVDVRELDAVVASSTSRPRKGRGLHVRRRNAREAADA